MPAIRSTLTLLATAAALVACTDKPADPAAGDGASSAAMAAPWETPETMEPTPELPPVKPDPMPMPEAMPADEAAAATPETAAASDAGAAPAAAETPTKVAAVPAKPAATEKPAKPVAEEKPAEPEKAAGPVAFTVDTAGKAMFLIDAPLEKIKGSWTRFGGRLEIDLADLNATRGQVVMDLSTLRTHTFGDPGKDQRQTGHALNWMEIGPDVEPSMRKKLSIARFVIESISGASGNTGEQTVTAKGKLTLHGITRPQTVQLKVEMMGPPDAPTGVRIRTAAPMVVSMEGHDVKPRDLAGRFLAGALEKVGEKVTDKTQVTLDITAKPAGG